MDEVDYQMLLDTLGEASKVRSKIYPSLNEKAALLYGSITAADMRLFQPEMATEAQDDGTSNQ